MFLVVEDGPVFVPSALKVSCFVLHQRARRLIKEFSVGFLSCPPQTLPPSSSSLCPTFARNGRLFRTMLRKWLLA